MRRKTIDGKRRRQKFEVLLYSRVDINSERKIKNQTAKFQFGKLQC